MRIRRPLLVAATAAATAAGVVVPLASASAATNVTVPATAGPSSSGGTGVVSTGVTVTGSVTISATGTATASNGGSPIGPDGSGNCNNCFQSGFPRLSLIGEIGNGPWQLVGKGPTTLKGNGALSLAVDDSNYADNTGSYAASITAGSAGTSTALTMASTGTYLHAGQTVTLSTVLTRNGSPLASTQVALLARRAGTTTFSKVATVTTDATGAAKSAQQPSYITTYEWQFAGNNNASPSTSPTKWIGVHPTITIHLYSSRISAGQPVVAWGLIKPVRSGAYLTIWRHTSTRNTKVGTVRVRSDGTWAFSHALAKGTASLWAHIPAGGGDLVGNSVRLKYTVG